jgi:hypothetical protein
MGSFPQLWTLPPPLSAAAMALVRGITHGPERRSTRRQGVLGGLAQTRGHQLAEIRKQLALGQKQIAAART